MQINIIDITNCSSGVLCLFTPKGLIICRLYSAPFPSPKPQTIKLKLSTQPFCLILTFCYLLCCASQHEADPVEHDGQIRREKNILDQHKRATREEECLDLETLSHTVRASRYSALHLKRLKTDDFSPFAAYDVHLASF